MKLADVKREVAKYMYLEDTGVINVTIATILSNRLSLDEKIWLAIVGESSGGKSQIINPILKSDESYFIKVDDITENTFLSAKAGSDDPSLLTEKIKNNMLVFSDLTVLFSRNAESRNAVLSQFRMIFDGHMTKHTGNGKKEWKGRMGVLAGCTPSIYRHFEEVADMGERFIYYRLRSNDPQKATELVLNRMIFGNDLDSSLSMVYDEYIRDVTSHAESIKDDIVISDDMKQHITQIAMFAEQVRTPVQIDKYSHRVMEIPISAMPMRVALQLKSIAKGLIAMNMYEGSDVVDVKRALDWVAYSLADETKRKILEIMCALDWESGETVTKQQIGDYIGLDTQVAGQLIQKLTATKIVDRTSSGTHQYKLAKKEYHEILRRTVNVQDVEIPMERDETPEETLARSF